MSTTANDTAARFERWLRSAVDTASEGASALATAVQKSAPSAETIRSQAKQLRNQASVAIDAVGKTLEQAAAMAQEAGIIPGRFLPSEQVKPQGQPLREVMYSRPSAPAAPVPSKPVFELTNPQAHITVRLQDMNDGNIYASLQQRFGMPMRLHLSPAHDGYSGQARLADGKSLAVAVDAYGRCAVTLGERVIPVTCSKLRDEWRARFGPSEADAFALRLAELQQTTLQPLQQTALAAIARVPFSQRGGSIALAELIAQRGDLTAGQAAAMPMLAAWVACDDTFDPATLTSAATAALPLVPEHARAIAQTMMAVASSVPAEVPWPEVRWAITLVGILGAASACERDPATPTSKFMAEVDGLGTALRLLTDACAGRGDVIDMQAQIYNTALQVMCQSLPVGAPRTTIADALNKAQGKPVDLACRIFSEALGKVCQLCESGTVASLPSEGLPLLPPSFTVAPTHVRSFDAPLGTATASWHDVAQRESFLNCAHASAWIAVAHTHPEVIGQLIEEKQTPQGRRFVMNAHFQSENGVFVADPVELDDRLFASRDNRPVFGSSREGEPTAPASLWYAIAEKQFAAVRADPNYGNCELCLPTDTWSIAFGTNDSHRTDLQADPNTGVPGLPVAELKKQLVAAVATKTPVCLATQQNLALYKDSDLAGAHVYAFLGIEERNGETIVQLVNPRGETLPVAAGIANDVHLAAVDLDHRYGIRNEKRGFLELPLSRVASEFGYMFWVETGAIPQAAASVPANPTS
jgi:hypothetical protein